MKNLKKCKNNSGITLIALVITIIVLIILAGISLNLLLGDNGIIKKAQLAGIASEKASDMEKIKLAVMDALIDEKTTGNGNLEQAIRNVLDSSKLQSVSSNGNVVKVKYGDNEYTLNLKDNSISETGSTVDKWDGTSKSAGLVGEGTEEKPYLIRSSADLMYMSEQMAKAQNITGLNEDEIANSKDVRADKTYYKLVVDISLENIEILPIGRVLNQDNSISYGRMYVGEFDGNNHEISNVKIDDTAINSGAVGFFGGIERATVKNLILTNVDIKGNNDVGGIVGKFSSYNYDPKPTIRNCSVSGKVTSNQFLDTTITNYSMKSWSIGGIIGEISGTGIIENCTTNLEVYGNVFVGGIVGQVKANQEVVDGVETYPNAVISNCTINGVVYGHQRVGGIIGYGYNFTLSNSVNNAQIRNSADPAPSPANDDLSEQLVGGLVGYIDSRALIENCRTTGNITIDRNVIAIGGLVGESNRGIFRNCSNSGNITCSKNVDSLGGIVGRACLMTTMSIISNCSNSGNVTLDSTKTIQYIGRLAGQTTGNQDFDNCSSTGTTPAENDIGYRP